MISPATTWPPMPPDLALAANQVHIFLASTDLPTAVLADLEALLAPEEKQRISRLRIPAKRVESLISRALLRQILSHFLHTAPQNLVFATASRGKPHLANHPLHFNLSHTAGMVLLAVSLNHELGIDIESLHRQLSFEDLARRFFTAAEHAALLAFAPSDRLRAFFRCWTRKEAILKATGQGISAGLDSFEVPLDPCDFPSSVGRWTLHDLVIDSSHIASLAVDSPAAEVHRWSCG